MNIGIDGFVFLVFLAVLVLIVVGTPTCLIVFGLKRHRRLHSLGAKVMIGTGMVIFSIYLLAIVPRITGVGPYRSDILAKGTSPDGMEYCVVQSYFLIGDLLSEPYQVSFYMRDVDRIWRWQYLAHDDDSPWRDVSVSFSGSKIQVSNKGSFTRELSVPLGRTDQGTMQKGRDYLPESYSVEDVLKWHNWQILVE
jgi:hypothetical protein